MAILGDKQFVERLRFFNGQRLFASDLDDLDSFHQQMRWLHNQSLHQPGVGRGYAIQGKKGDKAVIVQEGYAIDKDGREIVLTLPHTEQIPPVAGENGQPAVYDLTVTYPSDDDLEVSETRQGICVSAGAVRRREQPVFCWIEIGADGQPKDDGLKQSMADASMIRLARASIFECKLYSDISIAERRNARPPQQPYIACGIATKVEWKVESPPQKLGNSPFVRSLGAYLSADIATDSGGFRTGPCYFVEIRGKKFFSPKNGTYYVDGVTSVTSSTATGFHLEIDVLVQCLSGAGGDDIDVSAFEDWQVTWMGVEG